MHGNTLKAGLQPGQSACLSCLLPPSPSSSQGFEFGAGLDSTWSEYASNASFVLTDDL